MRSDPGANALTPHRAAVVRRNREEADYHTAKGGSAEHVLQRKIHPIRGETCPATLLFCLETGAPMSNTHPRFQLASRPISSESAHGRDKTWTWWRSHPVPAVLETQGTIKCATSNVIAGSWPITAQRSEPGDHWHAALPVRSWNHGLDQCNVSVGVPRTNSPVIAPPSTLRTPKERSSISSHVVLICT